MTYQNDTQDFWLDATKNWTPAMFQKFLQYCWAKNYAPTPRLASKFKF